MDKLSTPPKVLIAILISFAIAATINIYPMNVRNASLRPMMLIMVLIFWLIFKPKHVGVGTAFAVGLLADLLLDTRLGQQAFSAVVMAFVIKLSSIYIKELNAFVAWILACLCLLVFQLALWLAQYIGQNIFVLSSATSLGVSMLSWIGVYLLLQRFAD